MTKRKTTKDIYLELKKKKKIYIYIYIYIFFFLKQKLGATKTNSTVTQVSGGFRPSDNGGPRSSRP